MTPDEIDQLTIAQVRAIAERAHEALARLRDMQMLLSGSALLGGAAGVQPAPATSLAPVVSPSHPPTRVRTPLSDAELADMAAQREALVARNRDLPAEILEAERRPPP